MRTPPTMQAPPAGRPHNGRSYVSGSHKVHQARLRRRAAVAYTRLPGTVEAQGEAIGRHYTTMVHRRQGQGGLANVLLEIDAWEREGRDTTPMLEAVVATQLEARASRSADCPRALAREEQEMDGAEDVAQVEYLSGVPGAAERWRERLGEYIATATRLFHALDPARTR